MATAGDEDVSSWSSFAIFRLLPRCHFVFLLPHLGPLIMMQMPRARRVPRRLHRHHQVPWLLHGVCGLWRGYAMLRVSCSG